MTWLRDVAGRVLTGTVVGLLVAGGLTAWAIGHRDAYAWATRVPLPVWTALVGAGVVVLLLGGWRVVRPRRWPSTGPAVLVSRHQPYAVTAWHRFTLTHAEVVWSCWVPVPASGLLSWRAVDPADVQVHTAPRCPLCTTELEERPRRVLQGYTWVCVEPSCDFAQRSRESAAEIVARVEKLARHRVEELVAAARAKPEHRQEHLGY